MRSYVVTLNAFGSREATTSFVVGSSQPTPCSLVAGFRDVIVLEQVYTAEVDGYELPADRLVPFGAADSGSRQMRDLATGEVVAPRWSTHCGGTAATGVVARDNRRVLVRPCDALVDAAPSPTALAIGPEQVLGSDACALAPSFDVEPLSPALPPALGVACDAEPIVYPVEPGAHFELYATAHVGDGIQGAVCAATATSGVTTTVSCNPLTDSGAVRLSLAGLLDGADQPLCTADRRYDVLLGDEVLNAAPLACSATAQLGPVPPGVQIFDVVIFDAAGTTITTARCGAEIEPGRTTDALCELP